MTNKHYKTLKIVVRIVFLYNLKMESLAYMKSLIKLIALNTIVRKFTKKQTVRQML